LRDSVESRFGASERALPDAAFVVIARESGRSSRPKLSVIPRGVLDGPLSRTMTELGNRTAVGQAGGGFDVLIVGVSWSRFSFELLWAQMSPHDRPFV
jgi:hypothetical protein